MKNKLTAAAVMLLGILNAVLLPQYNCLDLSIPRAARYRSLAWAIIRFRCHERLTVPAREH